ncbi:MAG: helix-turn-helix domain-containing protein [Mobilitalea sp.]
MVKTKRNHPPATTGQERDIKIRFGQRIRQLRKQQGISQEELGFRATLHSTHIGMIERGVKNISIETIEKLSGALGIPVSFLFDDKYNLNTKKEILIAEINGIIKKQNEDTLSFARTLLKESLKLVKK